MSATTPDVTVGAPSKPRQRHKRQRTRGEIVQPIIFLSVGLLLPPIHFIGWPGIQPQIGENWLPMSTCILALVYVMFSLGLNIVVGYAGLLDLGYVAFFLLGAYSAGWFMSTFFYHHKVHFLDDANPNLPGLHFSFWITIWFAVIICMVFGVIIGAPTLRLASDYLALVTLGFGEIIPQIFRQGESIGGINISNGTKGIGPLDALDMGPFAWIPGVPHKIGPFDYITRYYVIFFLCIGFVLISLRLRGGKLGRAWLAVREDELAASLMGVPLRNTKLWAYAIGAAAGGFGGAFFAGHINTVNVDSFNFQFSVLVLCMVIVGGMGNVYGVTLGAILLCWLNYTGLRQLGDEFNSIFGTSIDVPRNEPMILGLILVGMMLFRRDGILPAARQQQVRKLEAQLEKVGTEEHAAQAEAGAAT
jgi:branched-chain amino acid transport system permease protein